MLQFYFLSILANALAGLALSADYLGERFSSFAPFRELLGRASVRGGVGVVALLVGFLKLLVRSPPAEVPVVGDRLPALAALAMGGALLLNALRERVGETGMGSLERAVMVYRVPLGIAGLVASALHFLLPGALFL